MAIYDTMKFIKNDVVTICIGQAASMAALLLSGGTKGKRFILPNSRVLIHQPLGGAQGQATDIIIQAEEIKRVKEMTLDILVANTGQDKKKVAVDIERDYIMDAEEALKYGIVDKVIKDRNSIKV
jgi:ATP-dependent Clp protease protease subunit